MSAAEAFEPARTLLEVRGVSKRFGGVQALSEVSLSVQSGECVALMGGNGAGKSTLVSLISGLSAPDEGQIIFEGAVASFHGPDDARAVGRRHGAAGAAGDGPARRRALPDRGLAGSRPAQTTSWSISWRAASVSEPDSDG